MSGWHVDVFALGWCIVWITLVFFTMWAILGTAKAIWQGSDALENYIKSGKLLFCLIVIVMCLGFIIAIWDGL
jgi:hypothetical protein